MKSLSLIIILTVLIICLTVHVSYAKDIRITVESMNIKDCEPVSIKGVHYLPLKQVFGSLGWNVYWDLKGNAIICSKLNKVIRFKPYSKEVEVDENIIIMDEPLVISDGKSYVSLKYISSTLGMNVRWNRKDNLIIVSDSIKSSIEINGGNNVIVAGDGIIVNIFEPCSIETINDLISYSDRLLKMRSFQEAINIYREICLNISYENTPELYASVQNNMGNAYSSMSELKNPKENINEAIECYKKALVYYNNALDISVSNIINNNLGNAYRILYENTGDMSHLKSALKHYNEALKFYTFPKFKLDYSFIQLNRGLIFKSLGFRGYSRYCLLNSYCTFKDLSDKYTIDENAELYALIQLALATTSSSIDETGQTSLYLAKTCYEKCLKVWTAEKNPINYAKIHRHIANLYVKLFKFNKDMEKLLYGIKEFQESLKFYSSEKSPFYYALTNYELGCAYLLAAGIKDNEFYSSAAEECFEKSKKIFGPKEYQLYCK